MTSGKGLIILGWLVAFATVVYFFSHTLQRQVNPNTLQVLSQQAGGLELQQNRAGQYVAEGWINGETVTFLLDTGATMTAVPQDLAADLGLEQGAAVQLEGANGPFIGYWTHIDEMQLGNYLLDDVRAVLIPKPARADNEVVLLGMRGALNHFDIVTRQGVMTLEPQHDSRH